MRSVLGAIYGGLLALIAVFVIDILVSGTAIGPDGMEASWLGMFRNVLFVGGLSAGIAIGAWRGRQRDKAQRSGARNTKASDD